MNISYRIPLMILVATCLSTSCSEETQPAEAEVYEALCEPPYNEELIDIRYGVHDENIWLNNSHGACNRQGSTTYHGLSVDVILPDGSIETITGLEQEVRLSQEVVTGGDPTAQGEERCQITMEVSYKLESKGPGDYYGEGAADISLCGGYLTWRYASSAQDFDFSLDDVWGWSEADEWTSLMQGPVPLTIQSTSPGKACNLSLPKVTLSDYRLRFLAQFSVPMEQWERIVSPLKPLYLKAILDIAPESLSSPSSSSQ